MMTYLELLKEDFGNERYQIILGVLDLIFRKLRRTRLKICPNLIDVDSCFVKKSREVDFQYCYSKNDLNA